AWCTVRPDAWAKFTAAQKTAFREKGAYPRGTPVIGTCGPPPRVGAPKRPQNPTPVVNAPD
ncbi:MAG: hypothetical protein NW206_09805, partial [Hyphomonadaceae bacterium]|nr:hypothetical protein [Hyphomonadaceae bacterium]